MTPSSLINSLYLLTNDGIFDLMHLQGSRSNGARTECVPCNAGEYQDSSEQSTCKSCRENTFTSKSNTEYSLIY